ncbi:MAG TPA: MFS transporter [Streptosporangiaceae bacterium]|nr:MFS transporter [Streptosporangiaceae bacterium]
MTRAGRGLSTLLAAAIAALAFNLRAAITSLPPIFPELSARLGLSGTAITVLATIPVVCFALVSGVAAPLSRRFGEERVLLAALGLLTAGLTLRGALPGALLFPGTVLASAAIALMNVLLPSLIKRRQPGRAGLLIGMYLLSLAVGSVLGSLLAVPAYRSADHAGWLGGPVRFALWLWAVPAVVAFLAWLPQWRYRTVPAPAAGRVAVARQALAWQVTAFMGLQSLSYYATLSWLPTLLRDRGASATQAGNLLALMNLGGVVTSLLIPVLAQRLSGQRPLVLPTIAGTALGIAGSLYGPLGTAWAPILLLGLCQGSALSLAIFFTMARAPDAVSAASLSGLAQGWGYLLAACGPLTVGLLHASTGGWDVPIALLLALSGVQLAAGWLAGRGRVLSVTTVTAPRRADP